MQTFLTLLMVACFIGMIRPFKPFTKRWQALLTFIVLFVVVGSMEGEKLIHEAEMRRASKKANPAATSASAAQAEAPVNSPEEPASNWIYSDHQDEMRGKSIKTACIIAENTLSFSFPYGEESATLCLRKHPAYGNDAYLSVSRGQFLCNSYNGCTISVKFSHSPLQKFSAVEPADYDSTTIFISNYGRFLQGLAKSDVTYIEAQFYQEGAPQMKFNTKGFDPSKLK